MGQTAVNQHAQVPLTDYEELNTLSRQVGWDAQYSQLDAGPLEGRFTMTLWQNLRLGHPTTNKPLIIRGTPPPDCLGIILPVGAGSRGIFQGEELGEGQVAIMCPNSEGHYRTPPDNSFLSDCIPLSFLYPALEAVTEQSPEASLGSTRIISTTQTTAGHLRALLHRAAAVASGSSPIELQEVESTIAGAIALCLTAARTALQRAHPDKVTVTEIAMRCGFSHMSYFARDYGALFGESPAQTLGKQRG